MTRNQSPQMNISSRGRCLTSLCFEDDTRKFDWSDLGHVDKVARYGGLKAGVRSNGTGICRVSSAHKDLDGCAWFCIHPHQLRSGKYISARGCHLKIHDDRVDCIRESIAPSDEGMHLLALTNCCPNRNEFDDKALSRWDCICEYFQIVIRTVLQASFLKNIRIVCVKYLWSISHDDVWRVYDIYVLRFFYLALRISCCRSNCENC